jgi:predicted alpha-1,2-mannosidase
MDITQETFAAGLDFIRKKIATTRGNREDVILTTITNKTKRTQTIRPLLVIDSENNVPVKVNDRTATIHNAIQVIFSEKPAQVRQNIGDFKTLIEMEAIRLAPGEKKQIVLLYDNGLPSDLARQFKTDAKGLLNQINTLKAEMIDFWENHSGIPYDRLTVPDQEIQNLLDASLRGIWQAREIKNGHIAFQVGPTHYRGLWIVDGAFLLEAAAIFDKGEEARDGIDYTLSFQKENGQFDVMHDFHKEQGIVLWTCVRHALLTQDKAWLKTKWMQLKKTVNFIHELREMTLKNDNPLDDGLIPPGFIDGGLEGKKDKDGNYITAEYTNIYWNLAGLKAMIQAAHWLGEKKDAKEWEKEYADFNACFQKAAQRDKQMDAFGNTYLAVPMDKNHQSLPQRAQWAFCQGVYPGQIFDQNDPIATGTMDMLQTTLQEGMVMGTGWDIDGIWTYFAGFYGHASLWIGESKRAYESLYAFANHASPLYAWREEQSPRDLSPEKYVGDMPHNWASAQFAGLAVHLLALDRGNELHLLEGLPPKWLLPGMKTSLKDIATPFGKLSFTLQVDESGNSASLNINPLSDPSCKGIFVHLGEWGTSDETNLVKLDAKKGCNLTIELIQTKKQPIEYVNMLTGTTGANRTEYGGTTPAVSEPFGMTQWCAATRINGISKTMYHYNDSLLIGFMASHQSAIWMGDYGFFTLMPQVNSLKITPKERGVPFDRQKETATPYHYQISYEDGKNHPITTAFTATSRSGFFQISYPEADKPILFIEAGRAAPGGEIRIFPEKKEIRLYNRERHDSHLGPEIPNLRGYYVLKFSDAFAAFGTWNNGTVNAGNISESGDSVGAYLEFAKGMDLVEIKIGSSFISYEQAEENMNRELPANQSFAEITDKVKDEWNHYLNKVKIKNATEDDLAIFYTAFFRTLQYPREFSEYGRYYSPFDHQIHNGVSYTAYSLWDTFRSENPWLLLVTPERINDMITALIQMYKEGGWIPKWPNPSYTNIMIGTHADAVIADAYVNGYRGYDVQTAYQAIRKNAFTPPDNDEQSRWGDRQHWNGSYEARGGLTNYMAKGYVANDITAESVARTLEFALDDYCVAQVAKGLGKDADYKTLMKRTKNYKNLYNPETGFFQAKNADGNWSNPNAGFTEGANWTYRFCVMQDTPGLIDLLGGKTKFTEALDNTFDGGHYRHDNEPGHHYVFLYNFCNRLDKTQTRIPEILAANYQNKPDGFSGNDDCGQMSSWYLFNAFGFYPFLPASGQYAMGIPHFEEISLELPDGKTLLVKAPNLKENKVLTKIKFNGKILNQPFIKVKDIRAGGVLEFMP